MPATRRPPQSASCTCRCTGHRRWPGQERHLDAAAIGIHSRLPYASRCRIVNGQVAVRLWLTSNGHHVLIQVWDPDDRAPAPETAGLAAESGRGLLLVDTLSAQWGCFAPDDQDGKIVRAMCVADAQDP